REAFGLVATLPFSAAHAMTFTLSRTVGDLRPALLGNLERLGGVPEKLVFDNDASVVASGTGARAPLHDELAGLLGALRTKAVVHCEARVGKDACGRVLGADYPVPPTFAARRVGVHVGPTTVRLTCEGIEIARHRRSFVPADVVLLPAHGRAIRLAREAADRL